MHIICARICAILHNLFQIFQERIKRKRLMKWHYKHLFPRKCRSSIQFLFPSIRIFTYVQSRLHPEFWKDVLLSWLEHRQWVSKHFQTWSGDYILGRCSSYSHPYFVKFMIVFDRSAGYQVDSWVCAGKLLSAVIYVPWDLVLESFGLRRYLGLAIRLWMIVCMRRCLLGSNRNKSRTCITIVIMLLVVEYSIVTHWSLSRWRFCNTILVCIGQWMFSFSN